MRRPSPRSTLFPYTTLFRSDATIIRDSVYRKDDRNLIVDIHIDEGQKYYFGNISWVGNAKYTSGYLDTVLGIKYGDLYNQTLLETRLFQSMDGRDITSLYMDRGHLFFQATRSEERRVGKECRSRCSMYQ